VRRAALSVSLLVVLVVLGAAAAWLLFRPSPVAEAPGATLAVYSGTVQLTRSGSAAAVAARGGDPLRAGDRVATGPGTRARIAFATGDEIRLDSGSVVVVTRDDASRSGLRLLAGRSWSRVLAPAGPGLEVEAAGRRVDGGPQGSEFAVSLAPGGGLLVDVFSGTAAAAGATATAGHRLSLGSTGPATLRDLAPAARQDPWPVLNLALDQVPSPAGPAVVGTGALLPGEESAAQQAVSILPSPPADIVFTASWGSGDLELVVLDPEGRVAARGSGPTRPVTVRIARARAGAWQYRVSDRDSAGGPSTWFVLVSVNSPSTA
jgi:FecR protein